VSIPRFFERVHGAVGRHLAVDPKTLENRLDEVVVGVECGDSTRINAAWISELLVNQFARLYPRLCLFGDDNAVESVRAIARSINPQIELIEQPEASTVIVSTAQNPAKTALVAAADGWGVRVSGSSGLNSSHANPFSAGAAASFAAALLFRRILLDAQETWPTVQLDLRTFESDVSSSSQPLAEVDVGTLIIAGVGAVGNASIWALARHPNISGKAVVVDPEVLELSNLQRYVLGTDADVGKPKTKLASRALESTGLSLTLKRERLEDLDGFTSAENVLVTVDNVRGRRAAQALLPRLVVNGWTSESGLGASWHDFRQGSACLSCLYQPNGPAPSQTEIVAEALGLTKERAALLWVTGAGITAEDVETIAQRLNATTTELESWLGKPVRVVYTNLICGSAAISIGERGRLETVPLVHQSALAGILAAAELVARLDHSVRDVLHEQNLVAWHDVTRPPPSKWLQRRSQERGCICGDSDYREVFASKWPQVNRHSGA